MDALEQLPAGAVVQVRNFVILCSETFFVQIPQLPTKRTVLRWLRAAGVYSCWAARKPLLTTAHINKRLEWVRNMQGHDFSRTVWSDEKIWRVRQGGGRVRVFRRVGDNRFDPLYTIKTTGRAQGVMVWAAMNGDGDLIWRRCPDIMDSKAYIDVLKSAIHFIAPRYPFFFFFSIQFFH